MRRRGRAGEAEEERMGKREEWREGERKGEK